MNALYVPAAIAIYFVLLYVISRWAGGKGNNDAFFRAHRRSPWWVVAFGMLGASISGVSLVSVPGLVLTQDMTYMQLCVGFFFGYLVVAFVLLPIYYKWNLTSIYTYLNIRFGPSAYRTGAAFFFLSKLLGMSVRLYLICLILHRLLFDGTSIPFVLVVTGVVLLIWGYTARGGVKSLVWTDAWQTLCLLSALLLIAYRLCQLNGFTVSEAVDYITNHEYGRWLEWEDWTSPQHFLKQVLSGIFIVVVMTGLDQDAMQKNLTCKSVRDAQKDMCSYGFFFLPLNWLFLSVGVLMIAFAQNEGIALPKNSDEILPMLCQSGYLGQDVFWLFFLGLMAATFSSADSALTALTTTCCIDLLDIEKREKGQEQIRKKVHFLLSILMIPVIVMIHLLNHTSVIDAIYVLASYTYGPLLGMFAFGIFTRRMPQIKMIPWVALAAPLVTLLLQRMALRMDYHFGYELLLLNGGLTYAGLYMLSFCQDRNKK